MTDSAATVQVIKIVIGSEYMGILLSGKPLTMSFPNAENPTHQFQIEMDEETRVVMTGGVTDRSKPVRKTVKVRKKKSR